MLDVAVEVVIVFVLACFFTVIYMLRRTPVSGMLTAVSWFVAATVFLIANPIAIGVVWLFFGIGIVFMIVTLQDVILALRGSEEEL